MTVKKSDIVKISFGNDLIVKKAMSLANGRNIPKETNGVVTKKCDNGKTDWGTHYVGALGEVGLAKYLGVDTDNDFHLHGDDGADIVFRGYRIAIRSRVYGYDFYTKKLDDACELYFDEDDPLNWDAAVLIRVWPDYIELIGCISRRRFIEIRTHKPDGYGYGPRYVVPWMKLAPIKMLFDLVEREPA